MNNAKIKGLLFDKDGTLFDFKEVWGVWAERVLLALAPADLSVRSQLANVAGYDIETKMFTPGSLIVNASADETIEAWTTCLPGMTSAQIEEVGLQQLENLPVAPVTDLQGLLGRLKTDGLSLGVATNDYEAVAHTQLKQAAVGDFFDFVCGFDSGFGSKPEAGMINAYCQSAGLAAAEVAMIGDSTHDLLAGKAAGVGLRVGVLTGPARRSDIEDHADIVLSDISFLPQYLHDQALL